MFKVFQKKKFLLNTFALYLLSLLDNFLSDRIFFNLAKQRIERKAHRSG